MADGKRIEGWVLMLPAADGGGYCEDVGFQEDREAVAPWGQPNDRVARATLIIHEADEPDARSKEE